MSDLTVLVVDDDALMLRMLAPRIPALKTSPPVGRVLVEGVNRRTHHLRPTQAGGAGGIEQREAPIHVSNVALVDPEDNKPTKVGYRVETLELENGRTKQVRVRFAKRSGKEI